MKIRSRRSFSVLLWIPVLFAVLFFDSSMAAQVSHHQDYRNTPRLLMNPDFDIVPQRLSSPQAVAYAYLSAHAQEFGLPADLSNLQPPTVKESLQGKHFHFHQTIGAIPVEHAEIIVSVSHDGRRILKVYNNIYPQPEPVEMAKTIIGAEDAQESAWQYLRVHGDVLDLPQTELLYLPQEGSFRLIYRVQLAVAAPYGFWELQVDAVTAEVLAVRSTALSRKRAPEITDFDAYRGQIWPRLQTIEQFSERERQRRQLRSLPAQKVNGTGVVFDPDPRTTLQNATLEDTSPAAAFNAAYVTRNLLDISQNGATFSLTGPWVSIIDFDPPNTPPSTTSNGNWTQTRGNNSFNDAMTYFHLDQNQRYIQSLGFSGASGIQQGPIEADTDGAFGDDNSFYTTAGNRLSFGHGCVDDNEDADVILHEYGHAITYSINPGWSGGDSGAIGEGFGDYWAASYSYSTPNGPAFNPHWVFSWDGHNNCWDGRVLNNLTAMYNPARTYDAHEPIPDNGGFVADELWSTPLFQALQQLVGMGENQREVDAIVLEAFFGLGAGVRMPDLASSTVAAAQALFPNGPHANVICTQFANQNILQQAVCPELPPSDAIFSDGFES